MWPTLLVLLSFYFWPSLQVAFNLLCWMKHFIDWLTRLYVFSFAMCFFFTCHCINSMWRLKVVAKQWSIVFESFWMSTPIMWCFKWMLWIPSTPSYVRPSSKNFESQKASCISFSPSYPFMPFDFFCSLVITPFWEICQSYQSSFCLWACIELTPL